MCSKQHRLKSIVPAHHPPLSTRAAYLFGRFFVVQRWENLLYTLHYFSALKCPFPLDVPNPPKPVFSGFAWSWRAKPVSSTARKEMASLDRVGEMVAIQRCTLVWLLVAGLAAAWDAPDPLTLDLADDGTIDLGGGAFAVEDDADTLLNLVDVGDEPSEAAPHSVPAAQLPRRRITPAPSQRPPRNQRRAPPANAAPRFDDYDSTMLNLLQESVDTGEAQAPERPVRSRRKRRRLAMRRRPPAASIDDPAIELERRDGGGGAADMDEEGDADDLGGGASADGDSLGEDMADGDGVSMDDEPPAPRQRTQRRRRRLATRAIEDDEPPPRSSQRRRAAPIRRSNDDGDGGDGGFDDGFDEGDGDDAYDDEPPPPPRRRRLRRRLRSAPQPQDDPAGASADESAVDAEPPQQRGDAAQPSAASAPTGPQVVTIPVPG